MKQDHDSQQQVDRENNMARAKTKNSGSARRSNAKGKGKSQKNFSYHDMSKIEYTESEILDYLRSIKFTEKEFSHAKYVKITPSYWRINFYHKEMMPGAMIPTITICDSMMVHTFVNNRGNLSHNIV